MAGRKKPVDKKLDKKVQVQVTGTEYETIEGLMTEELDSVSKVGRSLILAGLAVVASAASAESIRPKSDKSPAASGGRLLPADLPVGVVEALVVAHNRLLEKKKKQADGSNNNGNGGISNGHDGDADTAQQAA